MDAGTIVALVGAGVALLTGLGTLWVTSRTESVKSKAQQNEYRLDEFNTLLTAYRDEVALKAADLSRVRGEMETWQRRALTAERQVDQWIADKEKQ